MNRWIAFLALWIATVLLPSVPARADAPPPEEPRPRRALVADLGLHVICAGYQQSFAPWVSGQLVLGFYKPWTQDTDFLGLSGEENKGGDLFGFVVRGRAFFHPFADAPSGLWISPFGQVGVGWGLRAGERRGGSVWALGASVGYSGIIGRRVLLGGGLGLQYHHAAIPGGSGPPSFGRLYPQLEIQLGYAF